jgi:succinate dehydrogenase/fumarate reductase flavoprotein subunit
LEADILVIGGGIAGCFSAIKAREQGAKVILVDKGFTGKSGRPRMPEVLWLSIPIGGTSWMSGWIASIIISLSSVV